jgi:hypothetical protein
MTQSALAEEMTRRGFRWHQATVYKIENGERQIQLGEAREVAKVFGLVLDDMLKSKAGGKVERRLDSDSIHFVGTYDGIGWRTASLEMDRVILMQAIELARRIAEDDADLIAKIQEAEQLSTLQATTAVHRGLEAFYDTRVREGGELRYNKFQELYGLGGHTTIDPESWNPHGSET